MEVRRLAHGLARLPLGCLRIRSWLSFCSPETQSAKFLVVAVVSESCARILSALRIALSRIL